MADETKNSDENPENNPLDILFGTKDEAIWLKVKEAREQAIKNCEEALIVEREVLKLAESKLTNLHPPQ